MAGNEQTWASKRAARIREEIPITAVLADYGYDVRDDGGDREQQFPCNMHGDGYDVKPSARVYPESASWYCVATNERVLTTLGWLKLHEATRYQTPVLDRTGAWNLPHLYVPRSGKQKVVRISTKAGYAVTVTPDHKVAVQDVGWVEVGDEVRLKLEAFPFQRYGTLSGRLTMVSPDTVISEMETQPGLRQPVYRTKIEITENNLHGIPKNLRLSPGMEVTADIKVGRRRVISYFLDPLLKGLDESIREPR